MRNAYAPFPARALAIDAARDAAYDMRIMAKTASRPIVAPRPVEEKTLATNRQARYEYEIFDRYEAGIVLTGTEIKSARAGRTNLREAFVRIMNGEAWLMAAHISPYDHAGYTTHDPDRPRKLLLHANEIVTLGVQTQTRGLTIIPLRLYLKGRRAKVEIAVARGKKLYDKRATLAERDAQRDVERALKER